MRFTARVEIHDNEYTLLHERMDAASFSRATTDSSTVKRVHLPIGEYVTEAYATAQMALLAAMGASLFVDPRAEIVVSGGDQVLTHGCREVEENPWASIFSNLDRSTVPVPSSGLYDYFRNQMEKRSVFGTVPVAASPDNTFWEALLRAK
ncbi:MAG TPA: hypothetical protein VGG56_00925 [Terracidiphilus sp.]|jgi:hypothetical protein